MKRNADLLAPEVNNGAWLSNARFFHKGTSGQWADVLSADNWALYEAVKVERMGPALTEGMERGSAAGDPKAL